MPRYVQCSLFHDDDDDELWDSSTSPPVSIVM